MPYGNFAISLSPITARMTVFNVHTYTVPTLTKAELYCEGANVKHSEPCIQQTLF